MMGVGFDHSWLLSFAPISLAPLLWSVLRDAPSLIFSA
jgi:hypothetical protein